MKIANVIVDVPASNINHQFDYIIPKHLKEVVVPGMRVIIPFGPRKITGFVISIKSSSSYPRLKEIIDVMDLEPVLTEELLTLGQEIADDLLTMYITVFQAMLPQMLKAKYEKQIEKITEKHLPETLEELFENQQMVAYDKVDQNKLKALQSAIKKNDLRINYLVKNKAKKKYQQIIEPINPEQLPIIRNNIAKNAYKQLAIIDFFMVYPKAVDEKALLEQTHSNRQSLNRLIEKEILLRRQEEIYRNPYETAFKRTEKLKLTEAQSQALKPIDEAVQMKRFETFLLHGVTGSGKTEIYLQAIDKVLKRDEEAIVLVPEIALTPQMVRRFKSRFGSEVAVLHSALSMGEKYDEWRKIQRKEVSVVVGARSAIFAPFENLGIIIIDEEHETTYKQEESPRYHAKEIALKRAAYNECPVVLGSATPTLESFARAQKNVYTLLTLRERTNLKPMPKVDIIDMRRELRNGNRTMFSVRLIEQIRTCMEKNEQIVLLLNRRGYSNFQLCRDCGDVRECPNCDISLVYHKKQEKLKCHYCQYEEAIQTTCEVCNSQQIGFFGTGTEKVEESLLEIIPEVRVIRMDVDTTSRKGSHERLLRKFQNKEADILLGTQMIAKGLDFDNVTLVGVLAADSMLHLPDFRSSEKTFQLLTQVSGRAGRHELDGEVIIQTYAPDHYSIQLASSYDYEQFYRDEMQHRHQFLYPPYVYLVLITISSENESEVMRFAHKLGQSIKKKMSGQMMLLGPSPSPIARVKRNYRYQMIIKYRKRKDIQAILAEEYHEFSKASRQNIRMIIDFNPYQMM